MTQKINLDITGMHCQSCVTLLTKGLQRDPGVKYANVNFATEKVTVEFDDTKTNQNKIIFVFLHGLFLCKFYGFLLHLIDI